MAKTNKRLLAAITIVLGCTSPKVAEDAAVRVDASAPEAAAAAADAGQPEVEASTDASFDASTDGAPDVTAMSEQAMGMVEHVAGVIDANKRDCRALGEKLEAYYDENAAFVVQAKELYGTMPDADRKAIQKRFRRRFDAAWRKLQPTIKKCKDDPNVKDVIDKVF